MRDRSSIVNSFLVEVIRSCSDFKGVEPEVLVPNDESAANQELARRINLIFKTYDGGLTEFFDRTEHDDRESELYLEKTHETNLKRLIESSVSASAGRADA